MAEESAKLEADLAYRLDCLALLVQDPEKHVFIAPGTKWLLSNPTQRSRKGAVSLYGMIGASKAQMESAFGTKRPIDTTRRRK